MIRKLVFLMVLISECGFSQITFQDNFSTYTLTGYTTTNGSSTYTYLPSTFQTITDTYLNNPGTETNPNKPFNATALLQAGWVVTYDQAENDTFIVSTSWLDTNIYNVDRWVISPTFSVPAANTVFKWKARSPDIYYWDGYEVYYTTSASSALTPTDFPVSSRLFELPDNNTNGGGESSSWVNRSVNLSSLVGNTIRIAFRNASKDRFQLWLDNFSTETLSNANDVSIDKTRMSDYVLLNTNDSVRFTFTNHGASTIYTLSMKYQVGNGLEVARDFTNAIGWGSGAVETLVFPLPYPMNIAGSYQVKTWVTSINGISDENHSNDTAYTHISVLNTSATKVVLAEQFTSANNGDGPDAQDKLSAVTSASLIPVQIHVNDSMEISDGKQLFLDFSGDYSHAMMDRFYWNQGRTIPVYKTTYTGFASQRINAVTPASVSIMNKSFNTGNNMLSFDLKVDFVASVYGDYVLNAYLIENNVYGNINDTTMNGFNQKNDYHTVPWSYYFKKGNFVPSANAYYLNAWDYKHQDVLIHAFDGAYGVTGTIPSGNINSGQSFTQTFSVTVPTSTNGAHIYNPDNIYIVGFLAEYNSDISQRTILNSVKEKLTTNPEAIGIKEILTDMRRMEIYPVPADQQLLVIWKGDDEISSIVFTDLLGRKFEPLYNGEKNSANINVLNLPNGIYFVKVNTKKGSYQKKIIIQHN